MISRGLPALLSLFILTPGLALGSDPTSQRPGVTYLVDARMTYEIFEATIDHVDLAGCPNGFNTELQFCRLALAEEQAQVFVFSYDDDQPLIAVQSFDLEDGFLPF